MLARSPVRKNRSLRRAILSVGVSLAYAAISILMTYPAITHLRSRVIGHGPDAWIFWWNNWWIKKALASPLAVYRTSYLFFPQGVDLTYHSFSWLNSALWVVLEPLVGAVVAYNLTVLWVFPVAAWAMYRLVYDLTHSRAASFVAGLIYAFVPYRVGQINHATLLGTQWVPLFTMHILRAYRRTGWRSWVLAALFLVLTALTGWNLFLYLLIWMPFLAAFSIVQDVARWRYIVGTSALVVVLGIVAVSPLLVPMLRSSLGREQMLGDVQQDWMQTDLLAYSFPNAAHPIWGEAVQPLYDGLMRPRRVVSVGYVVMGLLTYGLVRRSVRRCTGLWWGGALLWWLMALGPFLKLGGRIYERIPLPYYPLSRTYAFRLLKIPDRYNLMLILPVAAIVGHSLADLEGSVQPRWRVGVTVLLAAAILFEFLAVPVASLSPAVPPLYEHLAAARPQGAIVELPFDVYDGAKRYMLYQTRHGRPISSGHVSRRPDAATAFAEDHPLLRSLYHTQEMDPGLVDVSRQLRMLEEAGFAYVVIHKNLSDESHVARWRDWLTVAPVLEDDELVVYTTAPRHGIDFVFRTGLTDGLGIIDSSLSTDTARPGDLIRADIRWGTEAAPSRDWLAEISLVSPTGDVVGTDQSELADRWPTSQWGTDAVVRGSGVVGIDAYAAGGPCVLQVRLIDRLTGSEGGDPVPLGEVQVVEPHRVFSAPKPDVALEASLGEAVALLGYDLEQRASVLDLTLYWKALRRIGVSYKVFVHLVDLRSGELVAQHDGVPRAWSYPTTLWEAGEVVSDEVQIDLSSASVGTYRLYAGLYEQASGARLTVDHAQDGADRLYLGEVALP